MLFDRLSTISQKAASDIKECASACDTYLWARLLVKILKSDSWNTKFQEYITRFAQRRFEFMEAMSSFTTQAHDDVSSVVPSVEERYIHAICLSHIERDGSLDVIKTSNVYPGLQNPTATRRGGDERQSQCQRRY